MMAKEKKQAEAEKKKPHFSNLNEDPALSHKLVHVINQGKVKLNTDLSILCDPEHNCHGGEGSSLTVILRLF